MSIFATQHPSMGRFPLGLFVVSNNNLFNRGKPRDSLFGIAASLLQLAMP
jgi:hypothetical protein